MSGRHVYATTCLGMNNTTDAGIHMHPVYIIMKYFEHFMLYEETLKHKSQSQATVTKAKL